MTWSMGVRDLQANKGLEMTPISYRESAMMRLGEQYSTVLLDLNENAAFILSLLKSWCDLIAYVGSRVCLFDRDLEVAGTSTGMICQSRVDG